MLLIGALLEGGRRISFPSLYEQREHTESTPCDDVVNRFAMEGSTIFLAPGGRTMMCERNQSVTSRGAITITFKPWQALAHLYAFDAI